MKSVLFVTNIPSPYRVDFYSLLGNYMDVTVIFEARGAEGIKFDYRQEYTNFKAIFLSDGPIKERKIDFNILKLVKKGQYDYVFLTNYGYLTELLVYLKCIFTGIEFVLEVDGGNIVAENVLKKWFKSFLLRQPMAYFSPSKLTDQFLTYFGADKSKIIRYNFTSLKETDILTSPLSRTTKNELKLQEGLSNLPTLLFVGQLIPRKMVDKLLNVLKLLDKNIQCIIVGDSEDIAYKDYLYQLASDLPNVHFKGFLPSQELVNYYQMSDLFVFLTEKDVWGLVINEALANGLPVISTEACVAATELIRDSYNGFIVSNNDDIGDIAHLINTSLSDTKLLEMSENSLKSIKNYTIEEMVKQHLVYMGVLDENFNSNDDL